MRRRRAWGDTRFAGTTLAASATLKSDLLVGLAPADTKTVTRIIGDVRIYGDPAVEVFYEGASDLAIGVVSKEAFDLETLPDPDAVADYPQQGWLYVATQAVHQVESPTEWAQTVNARFVFDIKAQRKVDRGVLFMTILNTTIVTSVVHHVVGRVRALCLT